MKDDALRQGVAFALPLAWFAWKKTIPRGYGWKLVMLLLLGASQGVLGWYMVMSGLVDRTDVSHFRLSAHLLTALLIIGALITLLGVYLVNQAFRINQAEQPEAEGI